MTRDEVIRSDEGADEEVVDLSALQGVVAVATGDESLCETDAKVNTAEVNRGHLAQDLISRDLYDELEPGSWGDGRLTPALRPAGFEMSSDPQRFEVERSQEQCGSGQRPHCSHALGPSGQGIRGQGCSGTGSIGKDGLMCIDHWDWKTDAPEFVPGGMKGVVAVGAGQPAADPCSVQWAMSRPVCSPLPQVGPPTAVHVDAQYPKTPDCIVDSAHLAQVRAQYEWQLRSKTDEFREMQDRMNHLEIETEQVRASWEIERRGIVRQIERFRGILERHNIPLQLDDDVHGLRHKLEKEQPRVRCDKEILPLPGKQASQRSSGGCPVAGTGERQLPVAGAIAQQGIAANLANRVGPPVAQAPTSANVWSLPQPPTVSAGQHSTPPPAILPEVGQQLTKPSVAVIGQHFTPPPQSSPVPAQHLTLQSTAAIGQHFAPIPQMVIQIGQNTQPPPISTGPHFTPISQNSLPSGQHMPRPAAVPAGPRFTSNPHNPQPSGQQVGPLAAVATPQFASLSPSSQAMGQSLQPQTTPPSNGSRDSASVLDSKMRQLNNLLQEGQTSSRRNRLEGAADNLHVQPTLPTGDASAAPDKQASSAAHGDIGSGAPAGGQYTSGAIASTLRAMFPHATIRTRAAPGEESRGQEPAEADSARCAQPAEEAPESTDAGGEIKQSQTKNWSWADASGDEARCSPSPPAEQQAAADEHWTERCLERAARRGFELRQRGDQWDLKLLMGSLEPPLTEAAMERYCKWLRGRLTAICAEHGAATLRRCRAEVDFSRGALSNQMVWNLLETLSQHEVHAERLKLFGNRISHGGVLAICEFIRTNRRAEPLQELHLSHNDIDDLSAFELLRALHQERPRYPARRLQGEGSSDTARAPVWLRLDHNRIRNAGYVLQAAENEGISVCVASDRSACGTSKCCRAQGGDCPLVHLHAFSVQERSARARAHQASPQEAADDHRAAQPPEARPPEARRKRGSRRHGGPQAEEEAPGEPGTDAQSPPPPQAAECNEPLPRILKRPSGR